MSLNAKLILKVKTGPGEIIGITELESNNGYVDFTGIQFSEPGSYTISVISDNPDVESSEFVINIEPTEEHIPQESEGKEEESTPLDGARPIIAQIDQPIVKLSPMTFDKSNNDEDNKEIGVGLGFTPFFWYNGTQVPERDISKLEIYYGGFVPKATVVFRDTLGIVKSPETRALNDTKFEIFLNSGSDVLKSIHLKFKLEIQQDNKRGTVTITGTLDLKDFYKIGWKSYDGTSFESLRKISSELELGFNSNIGNTDDKMFWRRNGILTKDFMWDIIDHSYISDESFVIGYIDYYWSFNYVDIEKEWKRDISADVGLSSTGVSKLNKAQKEEDKIVPMALTNDMSENSSAFYFSKFKLNNNSTLLSTQRGTSTVSKAYDRTNMQFLKFNVDSLSSTGDKNVILKGDPMDNDQNIRSEYSGKMDLDNVHKNYLYAETQNRRNLDNLSNISIDMDIPNPNFNLYKYQKINILFINQKRTVTDSKPTDERLSGGWMIIDIRYIWDGNKLTQKVVAVRKELGKTTEENRDQVTATDNTNNSEINSNPDIEEESDSSSGTPEINNNPDIKEEVDSSSSETTVVLSTDNTSGIETSTVVNDGFTSKVELL